VIAPRKLDDAECIERIGVRGVGRAAICGPAGPQIFPINYVVDGQSIVFRTSASSTLATMGPGAILAFEVDDLDPGHDRGWSVVAVGTAERIDDEAELDMLRERGLEPQPLAAGLRRNYVRLSWTDITGRAVGE
jgi:nitroimidazol reductase NimA-like FMN-containing flavoprotein (pyridoxamine 5'-phosphate oxidase superfamily)